MWYVCVCLKKNQNAPRPSELSSHLFLTSDLWTYRPGSHRRKVEKILCDLPSAVHAFIFLARRIQPPLSLVDGEVEFCVLTNQSFSTCKTCFFFNYYYEMF